MIAAAAVGLCFSKHAITRVTARCKGNSTPGQPISGKQNLRRTDCCETCMVQVKMVTGDQYAIAVETSKRLGLGTNIMDGSELLDTNDFDTICRRVRLDGQTALRAWRTLVAIWTSAHTPLSCRGFGIGSSTSSLLLGGTNLNSRLLHHWDMVQLRGCVHTAAGSRLWCEVLDQQSGCGPLRPAEHGLTTPRLSFAAHATPGLATCVCIRAAELSRRRRQTRWTGSRACIRSTSIAL